jgi:hypothetical protein
MTAAIAGTAYARWDTPGVPTPTSLVVVGYARVASTAAAHAVQEYFTVALRVDASSGVVTAVDSTAATGLVREWLADLLLGIDLSVGIEPVLAEIEASYLGQGGGAIRQAVGDAWRRYAARPR